ncbi:DUF3592 domain-containing protein [Burkholderia stagnalis]
MSSYGPDGKNYEVNLRWVWSILFMLALLMFCIMVGSVKSELEFRSRALHAEGKVVAVRTSFYRDRDRDLVQEFCPQVMFETRTGQMIQFVDEGACATGSSDFNPEDVVRVNYLSASPDKARIDSWFRNALWPLISGGLGLLFTGFGLLFFIAARTQTHRHSKRGFHWRRLWSRKQGTSSAKQRNNSVSRKR